MVLENWEFQLNQHKFEWNYKQIVNWLLAIIIMKKRQKKKDKNKWLLNYISDILLNSY